ncbi:type I-C CRISPR-associated protein Cas8c/Csd1 [Azospirillum sp. SYSU D00513]|uniref:type I-C CRISPR-associated protein Cas8c/Csd1 n=1 Tax=Azospirillum sp. SYSU D00513 TaxID=2812561 RepID=UPI001A95AC5B|nr:type I-C CRISPR-associated protein Cas8c/Csd1 [Azospirillum sp. SYSU D00513]
MIITELHRLYERLRDAGTLPPYGYSLEKVTGCIVLKPDGSVFAVRDERRDEETGKKGKTVKRPSLLDVPQPPRRTSGIKAGFLCDSAGYLFGTAEGKADRALDQFAASRERHEAVLNDVDHPWARAVLAFFRSWTPGVTPEMSDPEILSGWLVFRMINDDDYVHDSPEIQAAWERAMEADAVGAVTGQCLATGEMDQPIAPTHPAVKGVPGAQMAGAALVSFNAGAYESYGKAQNLNAPVSARVAHGYTSALNHLLSQRGKRHLVIGPVSVVFWTDRPTQFESDFAAAARPEFSAEDETRAEAVRSALQRLAQGRKAMPPDEQGARFFVLGLSPNAARLAVRFWSSDRLGVMADRVAEHLSDIRLVRQWDWQPEFPSLWALAMETKVKYRGDGDNAKPDPNDEGLAKLYGDLLRAMLSGGSYPASVLAVLLDRIRADQVVNHPRVALIKAVLTRRARLAGDGRTEDLQADGIQEEGNNLVGLDESRTDPGYRLGRLFAVLERIQQAAAEGRDLNATIRDKHIGSASATPRASFPFLLDLAQKHLKKVRGSKAGLARVLDTRLAEIQEPLTGFPATLSLEERGLFFLGYYHERAHRKSDKAADAEPSDAAETLSDPE